MIMDIKEKIKMILVLVALMAVSIWVAIADGGAIPVLVAVVGTPILLALIVLTIRADGESDASEAASTSTTPAPAKTAPAPAADTRQATSKTSDNIKKGENNMAKTPANKPSEKQAAPAANGHMPISLSDLEQMFDRERANMTELCLCRGKDVPVDRCLVLSPLFHVCIGLKKLDLSYFHLTYMWDWGFQNMLIKCTQLEEVILSDTILECKVRVNACDKTTVAFGSLTGEEQHKLLGLVDGAKLTIVPHRMSPGQEVKPPQPTSTTPAPAKTAPAPAKTAPAPAADTRQTTSNADFEMGTVTETGPWRTVYKLIKYHGHDETVIVPDGVRYIEKMAFTKDVKFSERFVPPTGPFYGEGLTREEDYRVAAGTWETTVSGGEGLPFLRKVILPESVKYIGDYAFCFCKNLEEINLPFGMQRIGKHAFHGCTSLKRIEVPVGTNVEDGAFEATHTQVVHVTKKQANSST